ncbi:DUF1287 domain-containing protein [Pseudomonas fluorescens]|uniref:DUF1287 domain-containing protein n=1 Tax=Pseudomonas fluorescens TaxID=294 RepID=A0A5E7P1Q1_PSEFL|nr:DUF1287 domain-containing protein [Pseudomonas fluorescens]VVP43765.1 hypothetical protein PS880_04985 [Pseudomonas fluorescens]
MRKKIFVFLTICLLTCFSYAAEHSNSLDLVRAARSQIGITNFYDPAYVRIKYPNGDVEMAKGVCTDVVIRAYRVAYGYDFQRTLHEDMKLKFSDYPKAWGATRTDTNIDHRRVPNIEAFLKRRGGLLPISLHAEDYKPGDVVTQVIGNKFPHIAIVSDKMSSDGERPLVIHNIGQGTQEEDSLFQFPIRGHYRFFPYAYNKISTK